ncbi:MAG TPA: hypothetical protein VMW63_10940 [Methanoregulaceae archaeon]|nr:hypothetical protein [Methanoregulaceae archaeon]
MTIASMLPSQNSLATGVGGLPHTDPQKACNDVWEIFPEFPYIPTLPNRSIRESIVFCDSPNVPGIQIKDKKLIIDTGRDLAPEFEQVYLDYLEENSGPYGLDAEYASGFIEMQKRDLTGAHVLKCQLTGPVTFGMQVVDKNLRPIYYDEQYADILPKIIALKARWCEQAMKNIKGISDTLVVLNEPYLAALGSSVIPIPQDSVISGWSDISSLLQGGLGIHCCSNTDWKFILSLKPAYLSLDALTGGKEFLLYMDSIVEYMEKDGIIAWGIVPADYSVFAENTPDSLFTHYQKIRSQVCEFIPDTVFDAQSMITPTCGIRFSDERGSVEIMKAARSISQRVREMSGE